MPRRVKDFPDADAHLTLLSDMGALKAWLGREETWCSAGRDQRAENAFKRLDRLIVTCAENRSAVIKGIEDREAENARLAAITTNSSSGARGRDGRRSCVSSSRVTAAETAIARQGEKGLQGVVSGGGGGEEGAGVADGVRAGARESEAEQAIITSREASEIKGISLREAKELGQVRVLMVVEKLAWATWVVESGQRYTCPCGMTALCLDERTQNPV